MRIKKKNCKQCKGVQYCNEEKGICAKCGKEIKFNTSHKIDCTKHKQK